MGNGMMALLARVLGQSDCAERNLNVLVRTGGVTVERDGERADAYLGHCSTNRYRTIGVALSLLSLAAFYSPVPATAAMLLLSSSRFSVGRSFFKNC
jgi:hypothetical protein